MDSQDYVLSGKSLLELGAVLMLEIVLLVLSRFQDQVALHCGVGVVTRGTLLRRESPARTGLKHQKVLACSFLVHYLR